MFNKKHIKITIISIITIIFVYILYNQFFYAPDHDPLIPDDNDDIVDPGNGSDDPFEGLWLTPMPFVDDTERVFLYLSEDQLLRSNLVDYDWQNKRVTAYQKVDHDFEKLQQIQQQMFDTAMIEATGILCNTYDQEDLKLVICEFDQGYYEIMQDGSYYLVFHQQYTIHLETITYHDVANALEGSWIEAMIGWEEYDLVLDDISYDTFGEEIYHYAIVKDKNQRDFQTIYTLIISNQDQAIMGISKNSDITEVIDSFDVITTEDIDRYLKQGAFYSTMVTKEEIEEIQILGYALTYDSSLFVDAVIPVIKVYVTSNLPSFEDCFDVDGIVVHPIKIIAIDHDHIRTR